MLYETYKYSEALKTVAPKRISHKVPTKAAYLYRRGSLMSTQPLLSASVVATQDNSCPLFQPGPPLPFTLRSNTEQSESLARPQDLFNTQMLVGNKNVQE